ncbi:polygalacturonase inhibitor-like [Iris pallida]|uniref:Polygalacturonase inhibitor-like n=1 Tax=Iris pallida TaxID=29817 RepID=A0AAX6IJQ2_IRIPA|nr:polygalacturonase inhibitor-like [Iris pallida]
MERLQGLLQLGFRPVQLRHRPRRLAPVLGRRQHSSLRPQRLHPGVRRRPPLPRDPQIHRFPGLSRHHPSPAGKTNEAPLPLDHQQRHLRPHPFLPSPACVPGSPPAIQQQALRAHPSRHREPRQPLHPRPVQQPAHRKHPIHSPQRIALPIRQQADRLHPSVVRQRLLVLYRAPGEQPAHGRRLPFLRQDEDHFEHRAVQQQALVRPERSGVPGRDSRVRRHEPQPDLREHIGADTAGG